MTTFVPLADSFMVNRALLLYLPFIQHLGFIAYQSSQESGNPLNQARFTPEKFVPQKNTRHCTLTTVSEHYQRRRRHGSFTISPSSAGNIPLPHLTLRNARPCLETKYLLHFRRQECGSFLLFFIADTSLKYSCGYHSFDHLCSHEQYFLAGERREMTLLYQYAKQFTSLCPAYTIVLIVNTQLTTTSLASSATRFFNAETVPGCFLSPKEAPSTGTAIDPGELLRGKIGRTSTLLGDIEPTGTTSSETRDTTNRLHFPVGTGDRDSLVPDTSVSSCTPRFTPVTIERSTPRGTSGLPFLRT